MSELNSIFIQSMVLIFSSNVLYFTHIMEIEVINVNREELSLWQLFLIFKKRFVIIFLSVILCGSLGFMLSKYVIKPIYTATASLYVYSNMNRSENQITSSDLMASQELVNTYIVVIKSDTVLDQVINNLNLTMTPENIRMILTAGAIDNTEAFNISINHGDPYIAQQIVNTIIDIAPKEIIRVVQAGGVEVIDYAKLPEAPSSPDTILTTIIGALIGLVLSFGISITIKILDTRIRGEEYLTQVFTIPVLGSIPTLVEH